MEYIYLETPKMRLNIHFDESKKKLIFKIKYPPQVILEKEIPRDQFDLMNFKLDNVVPFVKDKAALKHVINNVNTVFMKFKTGNSKLVTNWPEYIDEFYARLARPSGNSL